MITMIINNVMYEYDERFGYWYRIDDDESDNTAI